MKNAETTVIIRTKNNEDIISQTLKALFSQTYQDFDLIIVDSGSSDDTLNKINFYKHSLIHIKPEDYHPGNVLNKVIKQCKSELIVFLNSDTVMLHANCLTYLIDELKQKDVAAVFARQISRPEAKPWVKRDYEIAFPSSHNSPSWMFFSLPFSGLKRKVWQSNPFYNTAWASEDTKMGYDLENKGFIVKYVPTATVMHSHNYTLKQIFNRRFVEGEADLFIFDNKFNLGNFCKSLLSSVFNDIKYHIKTFEFSELFLCLIRRFVYQYAYFLGHKNAIKRKKSNKKATYGNYQ